MSGIADLAVSYPRGRADVREMHAASGVPVADILAITHTEGFPALADGEQAWELALTAARELLGRHPVDVDEIRYVVVVEAPGSGTARSGRPPPRWRTSWGSAGRTASR